jgi:hypothetical protein
MSLCAAQPRKICENEGFKNLACKEDGIDFHSYWISQAYPGKMDVANWGTPVYDYCGFDLSRCLLDPAFDFCKSFPEFCGWPETPFPTLDDFGRDICNSNKFLFCNGTATDVRNPNVVCDNMVLLSDNVLYGSSVPSFCLDADPTAICADTRYDQYEVCKDGIFEFNSTVACKLNPDQCAYGTDKFDRCALDWTQCLLDPKWEFCNSFPELCLDRPQHYYSDVDALVKDICASDKTLFCNGTDDDVESQQFVCEHWDMLKPELSANSSLETFCNARPYEICTDPAADPQRSARLCNGTNF